MAILFNIVKLSCFEVFLSTSTPQAKATEKMSGFRDQMKGFPVWQMLIICLMRFSEPIALTSLFPYVYFMVRDFHITDDPTQISKYTGYMGASFAFAQFLCCIHWGRLSDRIGRKVVLMCGLFGTAVSLLLFGFSKNYYMAISARMLMGALNGNIAVLQTMVGEVAPDRKHQSIAFSLLPLLWNVGCVVGPSIGGCKYFTRPLVEANHQSRASVGNLYEEFLDKYPYALSNVVVAALLFTSAVSGFLFLEETEAKNRRKYDHGLALGDWILLRFGVKTPVRPWEESARRKMAGAREVSENTLLLPERLYSAVDDIEEEDDEINNDNETGSILSSGPLTRRSSLAMIRRYSSNSLFRTTTNQSVASASKDLFKAFGNRDIFSPQVIVTIAAYFCLSFHCLVHSEFLPVFLAGKLQKDELRFPWHIKGGFSWESSDIGTLLSTTGLVGCFIIIVVFPYLDRHMRTISVFRIACCLFPIAYFALPYVIFTVHQYNKAIPQWVSTFLLYVEAGIQTFGGALAFPQIVILVYRATKPKYRAFVNSAAMSATSLARFIGPMVWGTLMSYFDNLGVSQVSWNLLSLMAILGTVLSFIMDEYDEDLAEEV